MVSSKQKEVIQGSGISEDYSASRVIHAVKVDARSQILSSMITSVVPADAIIKQCDRVRAPAIFGKRTTVIVYLLTLLVGLVLPLPLLVFEDQGSAISIFSKLLANSLEGSS